MMLLFPERLREIRREMDVTQDEFAQRVGVSRASLGYYENGDRIPDIVTLANIHKATGVSIYYLLGLTGQRNDGLNTVKKETGLSDKAIAQLKENEAIVPVLNRLFESDAMDDLSQNLVSALDTSASYLSEDDETVANGMSEAFDRYILRARNILRSVFTAKDANDMIYINGMSMGVTRPILDSIINKLKSLTPEQMEETREFLTLLEGKENEYAPRP